MGAEAKTTLRVGRQIFTHAEGVAVFGLGDSAVKWAERIRSPRSLADKLGVKSGMQVAVLGVTDEAILADLASRGASIVTGRVPAGTPLVLWRVTKSAQLDRLPGIVKHGLTCTKVVRFSDTDTAEKLVIPVAAR